MAIHFNAKDRVFKLDTDQTTYMIGVTEEGYVGHIYYGERVDSDDGFYLLRTEEAPFTPKTNNRDKSSFLDCFPMEYSTGGIGDYRESCLNIRD